jgi:hypothetical protein
MSPLAAGLVRYVVVAILAFAAIFLGALSGMSTGERNKFAMRTYFLLALLLANTAALIAAVIA